MNPTPLQHMVFGIVIDVAVKGHGIGDAQQRGVVDESLFPPSAAEDVQVHIRNPQPQCGDRVQRILDLLVRHQP